MGAWAIASNLQDSGISQLGERKPDCRRLGVSGCEEVEVTSLSDSRNSVVRMKRNKMFAY